MNELEIKWTLRFTCIGGVVFEAVFETKEEALVPFDEFAKILREAAARSERKGEIAMPMAPGKPLVFQAMNGRLSIQPDSVLCAQLISLEANLEHLVRLNNYFLRIEEAKRRGADTPAPGFASPRLTRP